MPKHPRKLTVATAGLTLAAAALGVAAPDASAETETVKDACSADDSVIVIKAVSSRDADSDSARVVRGQLDTLLEIYDCF